MQQEILFSIKFLNLRFSPKDAHEIHIVTVYIYRYNLRFTKKKKSFKMHKNVNEQTIA